MGQENTKSNKTWIIVLMVLIVAVAGYFYFSKDGKFSLEANKQQQEQNFLFSMKQECQKAGDMLYQADVKSMGENTLLIPEYAYNKSLNTCLYFGGHIEKNWVGKWVKDSLSNKEIISFMRSGEQVILGSACPNCLSSESFDERKRELFNE